MNKILSLMIAMLMSISLSSFAGTKTNTVSNKKSEKVSVPANLIVKQTVTFDDGKTIKLFYDLYRIKSTNFEKTNHVEGKCYASRTVSALVSMARGFLK